MQHDHTDPTARACAEFLEEIDRQLSAGVWHLSPALISAIAEMRATLRARVRREHQRD
jgi:hypothetical protein